MPHVIVYGGYDATIVPGEYTGDLFIFWSLAHRRLLAVQALGQHRWNVEDKDLEVWWNRCIENMQSCITAMDFESEDTWAYLVTTSSGPRIIHKPRTLYQIPCDFLWAQRVDVSEIDMQVTCQGYGQAIWRGREVDVRIGFNDYELRQIEWETRALKEVRNMDITYGLIAHIFRHDKLVGTMRESSRASRPVRATDRAAVFAAYALLESAFMINTGHVLQENIVMNEKGRVRMLHPHYIEIYGRDQREELERDAQKCHWEPLQEFFDILTENPENELMMPAHLLYPSSTYLAATPSPERFMVVPLLMDFHARVQLDEGKKKHRRRKGVSKTPLVVGTARSEGHTLEPVKSNIDHPDTRAKLGARHAPLLVLRAQASEVKHVKDGGSVVEKEERVDGGGFIEEV